MIFLNSYRMSSSTLFYPLVILITLFSTTNYALPIDKDIENALFQLGFIDLRQYGRSIFGEPDNSTGARLAKYNPEVDGGNPEELGSYLEGDILMPLGQARNGLTATSARWPNGIVPYEIRGNFGIFKLPYYSFFFMSNKKYYS